MSLGTSMWWRLQAEARQVCTSQMKQVCTSQMRQVCTSGVRQVCTSVVRWKMVPQNLKGRKKSSQDWLTRQLNDPYIKLAKYKRYRARSAFKLCEIDERHKLLRAGQVLLECGASPGAWTQVAVEGVNSLPKDENRPQGVVVGVDLLTIHPIPGATLLGGLDFTLPKSQQQILDILQGRKIDVVLSDMAPNATGTRDLDHDNIITLAYSALRFSLQHSTEGATFLCKIWDGHRGAQFISDVRKFYKTVKEVKPPSSRNDSSEKFVLAKDFMGLGEK